MAEKEETMEMIIEATSSMSTPANALIVINPESTIVYVKNPEPFFGYKEKQLIGRELDIVLPLSVNLSHKRWVKKFTNGELNERIMAEGREVSARKRDNTETNCYVQIRKLPLTEFNKTFVVAICTKADTQKELLGVSRRVTTTYSTEGDKTINRVEIIVGLVGRIADYVGNYPFRSLLVLAITIIVIFTGTSAFLTFQSGDRLIDIIEGVLKDD